MIRCKFTLPLRALPLGRATIPQMGGSTNRAGKGMKVFAPLFAPLFAAAAVGGCITVDAPDKPIVIELNVNIRQEVIYRLAADAGNTIKENEDIF